MVVIPTARSRAAAAAPTKSIASTGSGQRISRSAPRGMTVVASGFL